MQKVKVITLNVNGIRAAKKDYFNGSFTESRLCMYPGGESARKDLS